jgi:hypothetical protein
MSTDVRPTVHLHIGTPKSGTTTVQAALQQNLQTLAADGVWYPRRPIDQISAGREVITRRSSMQRWTELAGQIREFEGRAAVVSMETLCTAHSRQARDAVRAFGDLAVKVIITARDLARTVPAQWQESMQFRHTWTYREYLDGVTASRPQRTAAGRSFWRQHDLERIIATWADAVGVDDITVVTLPKRARPDVLWQRFAEVVRIDTGYAEQPETRNESLGAASAELMRRVNTELEKTDLTRKEYAAHFRQVMAKSVLAARSHDEPRLALPADLRPWAVKRSAQLVRAVRESGVEVMGELAELQSDAEAPSTDVDPAQLPAEDLLEAAVDAIVGVVADRVEHDRRRRARRPEQ